jgi:hypothetical protein
LAFFNSAALRFFVAEAAAAGLGFGGILGSNAVFPRARTTIGMQRAISTIKNREAAPHEFESSKFESIDWDARHVSLRSPVVVAESFMLPPLAGGGGGGVQGAGAVILIVMARCVRCMRCRAVTTIMNLYE